jgi:hypothetical protein
MADEPKPETQPEPERPEPERPEPSGRIARLVAKHPQMVSSFVIGVAGLIATTIWQWRNYHTQREQADAQQKVAETQAANSWKIARADILAKNLAVLSMSGPGTADQRFGVLLSLARADIIDPELAIAYALELGKDNPEYMNAVLSNTANKDYGHLLRAYTLSCEERYGTSPPIDICNDKLATRSDALGTLVADDTAVALSSDQPGPLTLLKDERRTQQDIQQLVGLFEQTITGMYQARQWDDLAKLAAWSPGAHLVVSLVIAATHTGELVTDDEAKTLAQLHAIHTQWLADYLVSRGCDADCKGRIVELMVSHYDEAQGDYDTALKQLLESPRAQSGLVISRLHTRLLWCQVDDSDLVPLRDHVLVPSATALVTNPKADPTTRDSVLSLIAVLDDPPASDPVATAAWSELLAKVDKLDRATKTLRERRASAAHQRTTPPPALKRQDFCLARDATPPATPP